MDTEVPPENAPPAEQNVGSNAHPQQDKTHGRSNAYFDFADASMKGDPRWARTAKWTSFGAWVVLSLTILSMIEIAVGAVWIASMKVNLNFGQIVQPILIPGLSFFNAIPSFHLHVLARTNPPRLAIWFSSTLALCFYVSALLFLGACVGHDSTTGTLQRNECPAGAKGNAKVWDVMVALQLLSAVLYTYHMAMAWRVKRELEDKDRRIEAGIEMVSEEEKVRRESLARDRWKYISAG